MNDLDTLRPEVREALHRINRNFHISADYETIRAELLRLAKVEAELAEARKNETVALGLWNAAEGRATKAEVELAALKARIADAPTGMTRICPYVVCIDVDGDEPYIIDAGKRVRLIVEE